MTDPPRRRHRHTRRALTRRSFIGAAAGSTGLVLLRGSARAYAAAEKLNIALVGAGGRGGWFARSMEQWRHNLVALCDVDDERASEAYRLHAGARRFQDFRVMIDQLGGKLDGVIVATPDHTHAAAAARALRAGLPVYCEKPLTHSVHEARTLARLATETALPTQLGNQGTASHAFRRAARCIGADLLGPIRKVYAWNTGANAERTPPAKEQPVPDHLQWDLWLGPAAHRPYHRDYVQGRWHPWADFGTGVLGNWACHTLNLPFYALHFAELWKDESAEIAVQAEHAPFNGHTLPRWVDLTWKVPERGALPPVDVRWVNGSREDLERIGYRATIEGLIGHRLDWGDADGDPEWKHWAGLLVVGDKGVIHTNAHNTEMRLLPEERFSGAELPDGPSPRGHEDEWFSAIKGGPRPTSGFPEHGSPLTEFVLLGNIACRVDKPGVTYRPASGSIPDQPAASALLMREYRKGWTL